MVLAEFRKKVVMTLIDIIEIDNWSSATVRRYLKKWEALTSFNYNGRYYVLGDIPSFDEFGLWKSSDTEKRFSERHGDRGVLYGQIQ